jgi:DNA adenine methylase Dam
MIEFIHPTIIKELSKSPFDESETEFELGAFGSPGGKSHIVLKLINLVPEHDTYIEPFAGGAALYWKKEPVKLEVLNDLDEEIAHAYKFIKNLDEETIEKIKNMDWKGDKEKFFKLRGLPMPQEDIQKFYKFFYVHFHSYGGTRKTFGYKNCEPKCFDKYLGYSKRMKNTKIFNDDYAKVIQKFDSSSTFIYLDPPYPNEWPGHTGTKAWGEKDVKRLYQILNSCKGKWLLSINNLDWIKPIFKEFNIHKIMVPRKFKGAAKGGLAEKYELLISNYKTKGLDKSIEDLAQLFPGISIKNAESIWKGNKEPIFIKESIPLDNNLYFMDSKFCYGILKLNSVIKAINGFLYDFDIIDKFEDAKPISLPEGTNAFIKDTKFLGITGSTSIAGYPVIASSLQPIWIWGKKKVKKKVKLADVKELIKDITSYDPTKPPNEQLADDWRIVNAWHSTYKKTDGKEIKFSKETIVNLAKIIYDEIIKRVKEDKMKHEFKPEEMKPNALELYKIVSGDKIMSEWRDLKFIEGLSDFTIIKDCINLIGSSVTQEHKPNDIDLLIKMNEPAPFIKRAVEVRLSKMFPKELQDKLHFVWGDKEGPHDSYVPVFDLTFRKIKGTKVINMSQGKIELLKPYLPQKPAGSAYYDLNKFIEVLT